MAPCTTCVEPVVSKARMILLIIRVHCVDRAQFAVSQFCALTNPEHCVDRALFAFSQFCALANPA
jgi:hypothetical protein